MGFYKFQASIVHITSSVWSVLHRYIVRSCLKGKKERRKGRKGGKEGSKEEKKNIKSSWELEMVQLFQGTLT